VERGLKPIIAGRNADKVKSQAAELGLDHRVFSLDEPTGMDEAHNDVIAVLNCAGPFIHTYKPMMEGCLRNGTHYLDITGEIPVFEGIAAHDAEAKARGVMLLPAVGFDVVPSDCLALHLKQRLPSATRLTLAFHSKGPAGLPPGTANTMLEGIIASDFKFRYEGQLTPFPRKLRTRWIDFGRGPVEATLFPWGDVYTAFYTTGIPNIEEYFVITAESRKQLASSIKLRPLLKLASIRRFLRSKLPTGSTAESRAASRMNVWGEVVDDQGRKATSRLYGPEAGVTWTSLTALAVVNKVLAGKVLPGFQTPALVYGADFLLECEGVTREDLI
jgi:short subunit dehydrogenase-like uncharacterized protein